MTEISIIVAATRDNAIGNKGDLLYHISEDMRHFKEITMGKPIIMGRKTFESFPKGALPGRRNIVITRQEGYTAPGIETVASLEDAVRLAGDVEEVMIIGGGEIYRQAFPIATRLYLTLIDTEAPEADTHLDGYVSDEWTVVETSGQHQDPRSGVDYRFITSVRRQQ